MQQHDIPELTPDEELDRTRVLPDPVDPLEGSARLPELRPEDEPGPEDEPEVPQKPKRRGRGVPRLQVVRIIGRLNAGRTEDGLQKGRILHPIAFFQ